MQNLIEEINVYDLRYPTSDTLQGSDPFHTKPNYSAVSVRVKCTSSHIGNSIVFRSR